MRALWATDLHLECLELEARDRFYQELRAAQPDVVLLTGDIFTKVTPARWAGRMEEVTGARIYFVLGNHDFYGSSIERVRRHAFGVKGYLPMTGPVRLTERTVLVGVDGWGDARAGNLRSPVHMTDWHAIENLRGLRFRSAAERVRELRALGAREADQLRDILAKVPQDARDLIVLTHVPPFVEACWYDGQQSSPDFLPWFTCVATGEVLSAWAIAHPSVQITVLCGHTHGQGEHQHHPNLRVRTGGWAPGQKDYGNPVIQDVWTIR